MPSDIDAEELSTISTEHEFMRVGDPVPVNRFDKHDLHITEHKELRKTLENKNAEIYTQLFIDVLDAHTALHEDMKRSI